MQKSVTGARKAIDGLLKINNFTVIVGVTTGSVWCIDWVNGDYSTGVDFSSPAAMAGYPHLTVPMGQVRGLPVGLSFVGPAHHEAELLALGYAYEQATHHYAAPQMLPTVVWRRAGHQRWGLRTNLDLLFHNVFGSVVPEQYCETLRDIEPV